MEFGALTPLEGGWSGETFLASAGEERSVVRIFASPRHGEHAAEVQAALLRLVRGLVPVPEVLEARPARDGLPSMLVTSYVAGERGDLLLPRLDDADLGTVGERIGRVAATFAGMPQLTTGLFRDGSLAVDEWTLDLVEWIDAHDLGDIDAVGLRDVAEQAAADLDTVGRISVVHSDLNPKNLLIDPDTLEVTAVLDLEYAHAGHPYTDLGNLLRFDRQAAYVDGVLAGWRELRGDAAAYALDLARAADLIALVDLAARRGANPVADRAYRLLGTIADTRNRHAAVP